MVPDSVGSLEVVEAAEVGIFFWGWVKRFLLLPSNTTAVLFYNPTVAGLRLL